MKQIKKSQLDEVIKLSREYWETGNRALLPARIDSAEEVERDAGIDWLSLLDFVDGIIRRKGLLHEADNEIIYEVFRILGWEFTDEVEESESV